MNTKIMLAGAALGAVALAGCGSAQAAVTASRTASPVTSPAASPTATSDGLVHTGVCGQFWTDLNAYDITYDPGIGKISVPLHSNADVKQLSADFGRLGYQARTQEDNAQLGNDLGDTSAEFVIAASYPAGSATWTQYIEGTAGSWASMGNIGTVAGDCTS